MLNVTAFVTLILFFFCLQVAPIGAANIITYHNDSHRTGWNPAETTLTPAKVNRDAFGLIATSALDDVNDQVDAQPLVVAGQEIEGKGIRTVVYLVTENNTVYAIDGMTGEKLTSANLGAPVPLPLSCGNNGPTVGINSTPTIDVQTKTLYVITYVLLDSRPRHQLHALDLSMLEEEQGAAQFVL